MRIVKEKDLTKWEKRFLDTASIIAAWSKDPSTQVGAVIVRADRTIAGVGYNGFARGVVDTAARLKNRAEKYPLTVHAEINAIVSARQPLDGCAIYISPLSPCAACAGAIIQAGIKFVYARKNEIKNPSQWENNFKIATKSLDEAGINVTIVKD